MDWAKALAALPKSVRATLIAALVLFVALLLVNQPLQTASAPQGIISFQMAGTAEQTHAILRSWRADGEVWARVSLWLDFLFIPAYVFALIQLTRHLMRDRPGVRERMVARWIRTLFLAAGLSDVTENILLLNNFNPPTDVVSLSATICALIKYTGLTLGIAGLVIVRAARRNPLAHG